MVLMLDAVASLLSIAASHPYRNSDVDLVMLLLRKSTVRDVVMKLGMDHTLSTQSEMASVAVVGLGMGVRKS